MREILLVAFTLLTFNTYAQESTAELITDRPDQTESSEVVPLKSLQIETGFLLENNHEGSTKIKSFAYNTTLLRYGLLSNMELRFGLDYQCDKTSVENSGSTSVISGFSPMYAGFKIKVAEEKGIWPSVALLGALNLPFSAGQDYKPSYTAADMRFSFANTLTDKLSVGYNIGVEWDGDTAIPAYFYSLSLGIGLTNNLGMYIESYGLILGEGEADHLLDAGFTYLILPNLQFDVSGGIGIYNGVDNYVSLGLTYRLPK